MTTESFNTTKRLNLQKSECEVIKENRGSLLLAHHIVPRGAKVQMLHMKVKLTD